MRPLLWMYSRNQCKHSAYVSGNVDLYFIIKPGENTGQGKAYSLFTSKDEFGERRLIGHGKDVRSLKTLACRYAEKFKVLYENSHEKSAFVLEDGERVSCHCCLLVGVTRTYGIDDGFLTGPNHSPYNGYANHICKSHLEVGVAIHKLERLTD